MLSCRDLLIRQGEKVLWQNLSFSLRPGERLGLSTPSGSGKTTLGRVLAGWQKPLSGEVWLMVSRLRTAVIARYSLYHNIRN